MADVNDDFISLNDHSTSCSGTCSRFWELVYWRNVRKSGAVFVCGLILLTSLACFSFITVLSYLALSSLAVTFGLRIFARFTRVASKPESPLAFLLHQGDAPFIGQEQAHAWLDKLLPLANRSLTCLRRAFLVTDYTETFKCAVLLYLLTHVGACFNLLTLIFIAFVGLFTLPRLYEQNKAQLDVAFEQLQKHFSQLIKQAREKVGGLRKKSQ